MPGNSIGRVLRLTTFGESHGPAVGGVLEGFPSSIHINKENIQERLKRRYPESLPGKTSRNEEDQIEWLSGIEDNCSTGGPIAFLVKNHNTRSSDYKNLEDVFRPSHADYSNYMKYGLQVKSGGGRSSGRETVARIVGGELARLLLIASDICVFAYVIRIGMTGINREKLQIDQAIIDKSPVYCPSEVSSIEMMDEIIRAKKNNDTLGGVIEIVVKNMVPGIGEPVFGKLNAELGKALLSIPSAKGIEFGLGFSSATYPGSQYNDQFTGGKQSGLTKTNHDGGIQGGISNGNDIVLRIAFKPLPSIGITQNTITSSGIAKEIKIKGRHDVCAVPRIVPVAEAMASLVLADQIILQGIHKQFL